MGTFWKRFWNDETLAARVFKTGLVGAGAVCGGIALAYAQYRVPMLAAGSTLAALSQLIPTGDYTTPKTLSEVLPAAQAIIDEKDKS